MNSGYREGRLLRCSLTKKLRTLRQARLILMAEEPQWELPPPPEKPSNDECCGSGCCPCVFDIYYDQLEKWEAKVAELKRHYEDQQRTAAAGFGVIQPACAIAVHFEDEYGPSQQMSGSGTDAYHPYSATICGVCVVSNTAVSGKRLYALTLDISGCEILQQYSPGDVVGICPSNSADLVNELISRLRLQNDQRISVTPAFESARISAHMRAVMQTPIITVGYLLSRWFDLHSPPSRELCYSLSFYCSDPRESAELRRYATGENSEASQTPGILSLLQRFPSCNPPLAELLDLLPPLLPRYYSITSSPLSQPTTIGILFSVLEYSTSSNKTHTRGLASGWLEDIALTYQQQSSHTAVTAPAPSVPLFLRSKPAGAFPFSPPADTKTPMILIATGTGLAPFLSFLEHRHFQLREFPERQFGEIWLFYGCRTPEGDFACKSQLEAYVSTSTLTRLVTAFSRQSGMPKAYVQDRLIEHGDYIVRAMESTDALLYVCGNAATMAKGVRAAFVAMVYARMPQSAAPDAAIRVVEQWVASGRYREDTWSLSQREE